jgi:hypothetical protein
MQNSNNSVKPYHVGIEGRQKSSHFTHQRIDVNMGTSYDDVIQRSLNTGVPKYKSFLKDKEIHGGRVETEQEKADKE